MKNNIYKSQSCEWRIIREGKKIWIEDKYNSATRSVWETCNELGVCNLFSGFRVKYYESVDDALIARFDFEFNSKREEY